MNLQQLEYIIAVDRLKNFVKAAEACFVTQATLSMMIKKLEEYLSKLTGLNACSLQPNSGAQGEYAGLLAIRAYHAGRKEGHRNIVLIPVSAHGTNPASAIMAGMKVVVVKSNEEGHIDVADHE